MDKKERLIKAIAGLKAAHLVASDALAEMANGTFSLDGSQSITVTEEVFERYRAALIEAKRYALQAQMILAE